VREHGSGNAGATNAWRVLGWRAGVPVLLLDVGKGALAASVIPRIPLGFLPIDRPTLAVLCGLIAVLGHVFPVYTGFRGGKGVATAAGMLAVVAPMPVAIAAALFGLLLISFGRVSLGSILGAWTIPVGVLVLPETLQPTRPAALIGLTFGLALFITITHRTNIVRLIRGEEKVFENLQVWRRFVR
jgi:glycerol-3-phosphate acyltransferase PlsY